MAIWTLKYLPTGEEKTFAEWGLRSLQRKCSNMEIDSVSFVADGARIDGEALFAPKETCVIKKDGVGWFYGRVMTNPRAGSASSESVSYTLAGPWWYLDRKAFQQKWNFIATEFPYMPVPLLKGRAILGQSITGARITTGAQIVEVLEYIMERGAPVTMGDVFTGVYAPWQEVNNITCAEVIRQCARWTPDAIGWFDYSTEPYPTFHIRRRSELPTVSVSATYLDNVSSLNITPRHDLQVSSVVINFERHHELDGKSSTTIETRIAPPEATGEEWDKLELTLELGGANSVYQKQAVKAETITPMNEDWWRRHDPSLNGVTITNMKSGHVEASDGGPSLPRELLEGCCPPWKNDEAAMMTVTVKISGTSATEDFIDRTFSAQVMGTSLSTQTYTRLSNATEQEETPLNLASDMYSALNVLHWEGQIQMTAVECPDILAMGRMLNITDGHAGWATMEAQIQEVSDSVDEGITVVSFGPPVNQGPQDMVELMRVTKRPTTFRAPERTSGQSSGRPEMEGSNKMPNSNSGGRTLDGISKIVLKAAPTGAAGGAGAGAGAGGGTVSEKIVSIDTAEIDENCTDPIKLREVRWCKEGAESEEWYVMTLVSEPYQH